MAEIPQSQLHFDSGCPDCGERLVVLPPPLPGVADDFDWRARDYDSFRLFLMQELAHRFPERSRWTPADIEVVIAELLAAAFDRASHAIDSVQGERFLDSARRPESVRRLLKLIGYDAAERVRDQDLPVSPPGTAETRPERLERLWRTDPSLMEVARAEGPRLVAEQRRMVTLADYASILEAHPLVARAEARAVWSGAWTTILVSILLESAELELDTPLPDPGLGPREGRLWQSVRDFHLDNQLPLPEGGALTPRQLIWILVERRRMVGTEVLLEPAKAAAVAFTLSVRAKPGYFQSELRQALADVFSADDGGFFEPGRLDFGEDLYASDIIAAAMTVEGVAVACLNRFKRVGSGWPDRTAEEFIAIDDDEYVSCLNLRGQPERGYFRLVVDGGETG